MGVTLEQPHEVETKILRFYKNLLSTPNELTALDPEVITRGPLLNRDEAASLIRKVTTADIDAAMWSIGVDKSPGIDRYNVRFFRKCWDVIKFDIYEAILGFFDG